MGQTSIYTCTFHIGFLCDLLYAVYTIVALCIRPTYTGSTSVMRGAVFGRIAGLDAAARKNRP